MIWKLKSSLQGQLFSRAPFGPSGSAPFELHVMAGKALVESDIVAVTPMDLANDKPVPGTGCTVRSNAPGLLTLDCSDLSLTGQIETPEATAALRITGAFTARGSLADARLMDASLFPEGEGCRQGDGPIVRGGVCVCNETDRWSWTKQHPGLVVLMTGKI